MTGFAGETEFWHPTTLSPEPPWQISVPGFATGGAAAPPAAIKASAAIVRGATGRTARATAYGFAELPVLALCPPYSDCNVADKRPTLGGMPEKTRPDIRPQLREFLAWYEEVLGRIESGALVEPGEQERLTEEASAVAHLLDLLDSRADERAS
jgi:hypothetical protein